ncbi:MAG TPA: hypothetical protein VF406_00550 [Thermodesulfobacteriota bacterium]
MSPGRKILLAYVALQAAFAMSLLSGSEIMAVAAFAIALPGSLAMLAVGAGPLSEALGLTFGTVGHGIAVQVSGALLNIAVAATAARGLAFLRSRGFRSWAVVLTGYAGLLTWWITGGTGSWGWVRGGLLVFFVSGVVAGVGGLAGSRWAERWGAVFAAAGLATGGALFLARIVFVVRHGGMDCYDCNGSPVAFLIGWIWEQGAVTVPSGLIMRLWWRERAARSRGAVWP